MNVAGYHPDAKFRDLITTKGWQGAVSYDSGKRDKE